LADPLIEVLLFRGFHRIGRRPCCTPSLRL